MVGSPLWLGLSGLGLEDGDLIKAGFRAAIIMGVCAHVVPIYAATFLVPFAELRRSWLFVLLSIWSAVIPSIATALISTHLPSLVGGLVATLSVGLLANYKVCNVHCYVTHCQLMCSRLWRSGG
jgi:L-lactate permease